MQTGAEEEEDRKLPVTSFLQLAFLGLYKFEATRRMGDRSPGPLTPSAQHPARFDSPCAQRGTETFPVYNSPLNWSTHSGKVSVLQIPEIEAN